MSEIIVTTKENLKSLIIEALDERLNKPREQDLTDVLYTDTVIGFLAEIGYKMSEAKLYNLTHKKAIPFVKRNGKLVFSRIQLKKWVSRINEKEQYCS